MCRCGESFWASKCPQAELSPVFEAIEHALYDVACFIEVGVVFERHLAGLSGGMQAVALVSAIQSRR